MSSSPSYDFIRKAEDKLWPCRKCLKKAHFEEDYSSYGASNDFKISCDTEDKCKTAIQTLNDIASIPEQKYGSLLKLMQCWNEENRLELEWFPNRVVPSSSELAQWDSRNSLRPSIPPKKDQSSTSQHWIGF
jgi:hypothetical protein